jgi:hypothetical protein
MWIVWLMLVSLSLILVIGQAVLLARDENRAVTAHPGEWSPGHRRLLKIIRVSGAIGLLIVWSALVYVLIDTGGLNLMQPWQNRPQAWGVAYSLMYTTFFLSLMRTWHWPLARTVRRPSYLLAVQTFVISASLIATLASLADLYYPPPMGSRVGGLSSPTRQPDIRAMDGTLGGGTAEHGPLEALLGALPDVHRLSAHDGRASIAVYELVWGNEVNWPFLH